MRGQASFCYAYAVLPGRGTAADLGSVGGVNGAAVSVLTGSLSLAVSEVPASEFAEDPLGRLLEDPEWTSRLAMSHFEVVRALFEAGPVLPLRLCTVFRSAQRAVASLDAASEALSTALSRVDGCAQWSVRVRVPRAAPRSRDEPASGADYLRRVAQRRQDEADTLAAGLDDARRLHEMLTRLAVAAEQERASSDAVQQAASYLVRKSETRRFLQAAARDVGTRRLDVDVRGPWAPYSFVPRLEESA